MLEPHAGRVAMNVPDERLGAVVHDLDRPVGMKSEHRSVDLHREVLAASERAPHSRQVNAHLLGSEPEARRNLIPVDVQPLRRDVDVDAAFAELGDLLLVAGRKLPPAWPNRLASHELE